MSAEWVEGMRKLVTKRASSGSVTHDILLELLAERERYDRLRDQFIKHRTTTHRVAPKHCETCRESDAILALDP